MSNNDLHDISTSSGKFTQFVHRWKHALWSILVGSTILMGVVYLLFKYGNSEITHFSHLFTFVLSNSKLKFISTVPMTDAVNGKDNDFETPVPIFTQIQP